MSRMFEGTLEGVLLFLPPIRSRKCRLQEENAFEENAEEKIESLSLWIALWILRCVY